MQWKKCDNIANANIEVSDRGEVRWGDTREKLKQYHNTKYAQVSVHQKLYAVHRLVAKAFVPNPHNREVVHHRDGNHLNNRADNLEWVAFGANVSTPEANMKRRTAMLGKNKGTNNPHSKKIKCIETGTVYFGTGDAYEKTRVSRSSISQCINGKQKTAGGYHWQIVSKEDT